MELYASLRISTTQTVVPNNSLPYSVESVNVLSQGHDKLLPGGLRLVFFDIPDETNISG
jgi:hypothetical protein